MKLRTQACRSHFLADIDDLVQNELYDINLINSNINEYTLDNGNITGNSKDHITINQELDIINFPIADPCNNLDDINDLVHNNGMV